MLTRRRQTIARIALPTLLVCIYATLGVVRDVTNFLRDRELLRLTVGALFVAAALIVCVLIAATPAVRNLKALFVALGCAAVYALIIWPMESIEEKVHFLEYGLVAVLALEAAPRGWRPWRTFISVALVEVDRSGSAAAGRADRDAAVSSAVDRWQQDFGRFKRAVPDQHRERRSHSQRRCSCEIPAVLLVLM